MIEIKNKEVHELNRNRRKNNFKYNKGFVVIRTYNKSENNKNLNPVIHICRAKKDFPVEITCEDICLRKNSEVYSFLLKPEWECEKNEKDSAYFVLNKSLKPLQTGDYFDMLVLKINSVEDYSNSMTIPHSNTSYRDSTLFSTSNLEEMIKATIRERNDHDNILKHPNGITY